MLFSHSSPALRAWQQQCQLKLWGQSPSCAHVPFLFGGMSATRGTPRATKRPGDVKPPANWTNEPLPKPQPIVEDAAEAQPGGRNPVRYGDWELKGLAIDF